MCGGRLPPFKAPTSQSHSGPPRLTVRAACQLNQSMPRRVLALWVQPDPDRGPVATSATLDVCSRLVRVRGACCVRRCVAVGQRTPPRLCVFQVDPFKFCVMACAVGGGGCAVAALPLVVCVQEKALPASFQSRYEVQWRDGVPGVGARRSFAARERRSSCGAPRCRCVVHVVDVAGCRRGRPFDSAAALRRAALWQTIRHESLPEVVAASAVDAVVAVAAVTRGLAGETVVAGHHPAGSAWETLLHATRRRQRFTEVRLLMCIVLDTQW